MQFFKRNPYGGCIYLAIIWCTSFQPASPKAKEKLSKFDFHRNLTGIYFDPVDFIISNALPIELDETGVSVLLRKIHSRFDTIMVSVDVPQRYAAGNFSNDQLPKTAARFNLLPNTGQPSAAQHLKLAILIKVQSWGEKKMIRSRFQDIKNIVIGANSIFPKTVQTVVLEMANFTDEATQNYLDFRDIFVDSATLGITVGIEDAIETLSSNSMISDQFIKDIILDHFVEVVYLTQDDNVLVTGIPVKQVVADLEAQFRRCKNLIQNLSNVTKLALVTTWADTNEEGLANYTRFGEFWEGINEWAEKSKTSNILLQAFDTPLKSGPWTTRTNGWWRLLPNSSYDHPSQFNFKEKTSLTEEKSSAENMTWLSQPIEFNRDAVGVHFSLFSLKPGGSKSEVHVEASLPILIEKISTKFSKVFISTLYNDKEPYFNQEGNITSFVPSACAKWNSDECKNKKTKSMELIMAFDETTAENVTRSAREANLLSPATVSQLIYFPTIFEKGRLLDGYLAMINMSDKMKTFKLGIKLDMEVCNEQARFPTVMDLLHEDFFTDIKIKVLYFSAIVPIENAKLGSDRFLPLLTAMFENCKKKVYQYLANQTEPGGVEVAFITGWPITDEENIHELVQFISFWEGVNDWAVNTDTSIILSSAYDPLVAGANPGANDKYGLWRIKVSSMYSKAYDFQDKKEVAFQYAKKKLEDENRESSNSLTIIIASISTVATIVIVAMFTVFYLLKRRQSNGLTKIEILRFFNGGDSTSYVGSPEDVGDPYQKNELEVSRDSFTIDESSSLGSGEFGKVCRGTVTKDGVVDEVAVKMMKVPAKAFALRGLMFEIKILSYLGQHPNIVGLVGAYTAELNKSVIFVFLELCGLGSLQSFLRECKTSEKHKHFIEKAESCDAVEDRTDFNQEWYVTVALPDFKDEEEAKLDLDDTIVNYMAIWSFEIANGMEFIASKHIVHLDLATRNVLLTSEKRAKITDFGLSRRMYDYQSYIKKHPEPLPWRSMAPESLKNTEFTEKSDVWAFGILLWEIYSLGNVPYPGLSWDVNLPTKLEQGLRPGEPTYNQNEMYSIMSLCWSTSSERRPTFSELVTLLKTTLGDCHPTSSEINSESFITNRMKKSVVEVETECDENNDVSDFPHPSSKDQNKISPDGRWVWPSMALVWLLIIIVLSIVWSVWGVGVQVKSSEDTCIPNHESAQNGSVTTSSPIDAGHGQPRNRSRTDLGLKLFTAIAGDGKKEEAVKALVQFGADVNVKNELSRTPLISASNCSSDKSICLRIIEVLIENGADVYATAHDDPFNYTFLQDFFGSDPVTLTPPQFHQITAYLISKNMSKLFAGRDGDIILRSPLELAVIYMEVENRTLLLLYQNDVMFNDTITNSEVLKNAVMFRRSPQFISTLIEFGANLRYLDDDDNDNSLLHTAAAHCYPEGIQYFLHKGLVINDPNELGETPLHLAVKCGEDEEYFGNIVNTVRVLIDNGANVSIRANDGRIPLTIVTKRNDLSEKDKVVQILREADTFNPGNLTKEELAQKLFDAIDQLNEDNVELLIQFGADLTVRINPGGDTLLMRVTKCCYPKEEKTIRFRIIKLLITNGANVSAQNPQSEDRTFLHNFVDYFNPSPSQFHEVVGYLAATNSSKLFNMKGSISNQSLFQSALFQVAMEMRTLNLLHEGGVDFKWKDKLGSSALYYAVAGNRSVELLARLIDLGVDWKSANKANQTLLHEAAVTSFQALEFFLKKGLDVNARDVEGDNPLHKAVRSCDENDRILEIVQLLIENGGDAKIKNKEGDTPVGIASREECDKSVIQLLKGTE